MSRDEITEAWKILEQLNDEGFDVTITISDKLCQRIFLTGGDCNCPHLKLYDRADGHGYTWIDSEDWPIGTVDWDHFTIPVAVRTIEMKLREAYAQELRARG